MSGSLRGYLFHEEPGITLYCGDCREVLPHITDAPIVAIIDPPYGDTSIEWDEKVPDWLVPLGEILERNGTIWCFGSMRFLMGADFPGWRLSQDLVWEKHNGSSFLNDRFRRVHEHIAQFYRKATSWTEVRKSPVFTLDATPRVVRKKAKPPHWHGATGATTYVSEDGGPRLMRSVLRVRSEHMRADHPTQKPVGVIRPLLEYSCPEGEIAIDPMCGSGTTLVAARELHRRAIGIEIEPRYCEIAVKRLRQEVLAL